MGNCSFSFIAFNHSAPNPSLHMDPSANNFESQRGNCLTSTATKLSLSLKLENGGERLINFFSEAENKGMNVGAEEAKLLYKRFYPCFIRAFLDAADFGAATKVTQKGGGKVYGNTKTTGDDYVQFREFRLLCTYLCVYAAIYEAFGNVDGGGKGIDATDDRRISKDEWTTNGNLLKGHPLLSLSIGANGDPSMIFDAMDGDGKGKVLLAEFSTYIEDYEFSLKTRWGKLLNAGEPAVASAGEAVAAAAAV